MDITKKNRNALRAYFKKGSIPKESEFADLVDGTLNCVDDGILRLPDNPLCIRADSSNERKGILDFYQDFTDVAPEWKVALRHIVNPGDPAKAGLSITDNAGASRLFIEHSTGNVGIGIAEPTARLHVAGEARIDGNLVVTGQMGTLEWKPLPFYATNKWKNFGNNYQVGEYSKDPFGIVRLRGMIQSGTLTVNDVIAQLPADCRPLHRQVFCALNANAPRRIDVLDNGDLVCGMTMVSGWMNLESIQFTAKEV